MSTQNRAGQQADVVRSATSDITPRYLGRPNQRDRQLDFDEVELGFDDFKPLTLQEAQQVRRQIKTVSVMRILWVQALAGALVALAVWGVTGRQSAGISAVYGAFAVVVPAALFARGLRRQQTAADAGSALLGFFVWELVKVGVTVAMLLAAPRVVIQLSWLALLAGFVVTMKVYWLAMWLQLKQPSCVN